MKTCSNVEIRYCAVQPDETFQHAKRHRRGSLHSPSPTSPEVHVMECKNPSSPAKAFIKINNKPTNDWKVFYAKCASVKPVISWRVDCVQNSKPITGFCFGVAKENVLMDPSNRDKPLRLCKGTKVITKEGVYVDGYRRTIDVPKGAEKGFAVLENTQNNTVFSIENANHPVTNRKVTALKVDDIPVYYFTNTEKDVYVPCKFLIGPIPLNSPLTLVILQVSIWPMIEFVPSKAHKDHHTRAFASTVITFTFTPIRMRKSTISEGKPVGTFTFLFLHSHQI